jgi:hypothetical protein
VDEGNNKLLQYSFLILDLLLIEIRTDTFKGLRLKRCLGDTHAPAEEVLKSLMFGAFKQMNGQTGELATSNK